MILVIGEVLIDIFQDYERIGGAPFNFAFHLKHLGWPVRLLTRIGNDPRGKDIQALFARHGFDPSDVQIDPHHATGTVQVALDVQGVPRFDIRSDVAYDYLEPDLFESVDWSSVEMIYFGSLAQRTAAAFGRIQHCINQRLPHTRVFCDINLRPPHVNKQAVLASLAKADIVKLNIEELAVIRGMSGAVSKREDGIDWMMRHYSIETLILTCGNEGSKMCSAGQRVFAVPPSDVQIVDTVGAGDAYAAVSAVGLLEGLPLQTVATTASEFAAHICTLPGAVPEDKTVYKVLRNKLKG